MATLNTITGKTNEEVLAESTRVAKEAAASIGGTFEQGTGFKAGDSIKGDDFIPATSNDALTADIVPDNIPDVTALDSSVAFAPEEATPAGSAFEEGMTQLDEFNKLLSGESKFRAEEERARGVGVFEEEQADLSAQLRDIQAETKAIPLQLQKEATGRGITVGGLQPLQSARLRDNAIQALGVSSLLLGVQGKISAAMAQVDRAAEIKFGTAKAEKENLIEKLGLIAESPETSRQERNAALKQQAIQQAQLREIEKEEKSSAEINRLAIDAARQGGGTLLARKIQNADSVVDAVSLMAQAGLSVGESGVDLDTKIIEANGRQLLVNTQTGETIADFGTATGKPPTTSQFQAAGYAQRLVQAENIFADVEDKILELSTSEFLIQKNLPNALQSPDMQSLQQAQRNFVNAVLRRESGAAIAPSEFESAEKQYFPQPGDSKQVIANKRANRAVVQDSFKKEASTAFEPSPFTNLPSFDTASVVTQDVATKIAEAEALNYQPLEILDFLSASNPDMKASIEEARNADFDDAAILEFLKSQK